MNSPPLSYKEVLALVDQAGPIAIKKDGSEVYEPSYNTQFIPMQIPMEGPGVIALDDVEPAVAGSAEQPDMLLKLEMLGFNVGSEVNVKRKERAIMQLTVGQHKWESNTEPLFWVLSAGLELYSKVKDKKADFKELAVEVDKAFNKEYIEVPGGAIEMRFDVIQERNPTWWSELFGFVKSAPGQALSAAFGLPGIPQIAVKTVEGLIDNLKAKNKDVLFSTQSEIPLAVSQYGIDRMTKKHTRVQIGCLNPGVFLLAQGKDYQLFRDKPGIFDITSGEYYPADFTTADRMSGRENPFKKLSFAVFRIEMTETNLSNKYNFRSA